MPREYNITWSENDSKELNRLVKNFNAKVKRLEANSKYSNVILPERLSVKELKNIIVSRRDLQNELESLQAFTQRGSEKIVDIPNTKNNIKMTTWQREEMLRRTKLVNDKRYYHKKKLEAMSLEHQGKALNYTRGDIGMGKVEVNMFKPTKTFTKGMDQYSANEKMKHLMRESQSTYWTSRDLLMRENFIKALEENFNPKDVKNIIDAIERMPVRSFKEKLLSDPEDFNTAYPPDDEQYQAFLTKLNSTWLPESKPKPKRKTKKRAGKK